MYQILIVIAAALWGIDGILRRQTYSLPATVVVFWEHVIGLIILLLAPRLIDKNMSLAIHRKKSFQALVLVALFSGVAGTVAFTAALQQVGYIPLSIVFFVQKLQPIFTILTARVVLKEKPHPAFWMWVVVAFLASYFLTFPSGKISISFPLQPHVWAALLAFCAAFAWGSSTVFSKIALTGNSLYSVATMRFLLTALFSLPVVFLFQTQDSLFAIQPQQIAILLIIAFSTGMAALTIYYKGLQKVPAHISSILELAFPLTGLLVDIFVYKTVITPSQLLAAVVLAFVMFQILRLPKYAHS